MSGAELEYHDACLVFPAMSADDYRTLRESIRLCDANVTPT